MMKMRGMMKITYSYEAMMYTKIIKPPKRKPYNTRQQKPKIACNILFEPLPIGSNKVHYQELNGNHPRPFAPLRSDESPSRNKSILCAPLP